MKCFSLPPGRHWFPFTKYKMNSKDCDLRQVIPHSENHVCFYAKTTLTIKTHENQWDWLSFIFTSQGENGDKRLPGRSQKHLKSKTHVSSCNEGTFEILNWLKCAETLAWSGGKTTVCHFLDWNDYFAYRIYFKKNVHKYARQSVQRAISGDENTPRKMDLVLHINIHAFVLCTEFLKVLEKADFPLKKMEADSL